MELRHTPRLYLDAALAKGQTAELAAEQAHYLQNVLRVKAGDVVRLFNVRDGEWKASVAGLSKKSVTLALHEQTRRPQVEPELWLCAAPIKKAHFDYMIEKATELGVTTIQPILTSRTQIREVNTDRCRAIAIEAAEQSERLTIPDIRKPVMLSDLAANWPVDRQLIVCAEWGDATPIGEALEKNFVVSAAGASLPLAGGTEGGQANTSAPVSQPALHPSLRREGSPIVPPSTAILTGPEGGLAAEELEKLRALSRAIFVRLGPRILRADTAAIAALTCWQAQCGDWR